ncbi:MAG: FKBP-type peptidyl-prolyl cis-trans isomerase [Candidatus Yanofskybacteria bacterium]|nr:FKBP-type peptidyl-prolyl cis-trans isomerase [Candidatus Yanofskybacteria bacterium]
MTKSIFIFTILVVFVAIAVWFVIQKTKEVGRPVTSDVQRPSDVVNPSDDKNAVTETTNEPIQYDNGLTVQDVVVGTGKTAENGDTLSAHYVGALEDGTVFDESYGRGQPIQFVLGSGQLIQGWELGLVGMKEGGKRRLVIPPELGYGERGAGGGAIPPNATLLFEIELVGVTKQ